MKITIRTKYVGPNEAGRGARIVARGGGRSATVPYDHSAREPHRIAAEKLAEKLADSSFSVIETSGGPDGRVFEAVVS